MSVEETEGEPIAESEAPTTTISEDTAGSIENTEAEIPMMITVEGDTPSVSQDREAHLRLYESFTNIATFSAALFLIAGCFRFICRRRKTPPRCKSTSCCLREDS